MNRENIYRDQIDFSSRLKPCWGLLWSCFVCLFVFDRTFKLLLLEQTSVDQLKNFAIFFKTSAVVSFCSLLVLCAAMNCHFSYHFCAFCRVLICHLYFVWAQCCWGNMDFFYSIPFDHYDKTGSKLTLQCRQALQAYPFLNCTNHFQWSYTERKRKALKWWLQGLLTCRHGYFFAQIKGFLFT